MSILGFVHRARQNHALEHATVHLLSRANPYVRIVGRSTNTGFFIYGGVSTQDLANAATEALARLQQGEHHLAIHPRCGTNLAVTGLVSGLAAFGVTLGRPRSRLERLPMVLTVATVAAIAAQPLALKVQEQITTSADVEGLCIAGITRQVRAGYVIHKVTVGRE